MVNITLTYFPLDPLSRGIRILLNAKKIPYIAVPIDTPFETEPSLHCLFQPKITADSNHYKGFLTCSQWIENHYPLPSYVSHSPHSTVLMYQWVEFMLTFGYEMMYKWNVTEHIVTRLLKQSPNGNTIIQARQAVTFFFSKIELVLEVQDWLVIYGESWVDFLLTGFISSLEYMFPLKWNQYPCTREWYGKLKSHPAYSPLLKDTVVNITPQRQFALLDD